MPFRRITDPERLQSLVGAMLLIAEDVDLPAVLRSITERAVDLAGARCGALGVLDDRHQKLKQFVTVNVDEDEIVSRIALLPDEKGILAVPIQVQGEAFGTLFLCDKTNGRGFTEVEEDEVSALALAAGLAIDKARLYTRLRELTLSEERERIARNLHDTVIQRLFAVGLTLQSTTRLLGRSEAQDRLQSSIDDLDETIRQIRTTIFAISRSRSVTGKGLRSAILDLSDEAAGGLGLDVRVDFDGPIDAAVGPESAEHLLITVREALANVVQHAEASTVEIDVKVDDAGLGLRVVDDGIGIDLARAEVPGRGLANLQERARLLGGNCSVFARPEGGTELSWCVKLLR